MVRLKLDPTFQVLFGAAICLSVMAIVLADFGNHSFLSRLHTEPFWIRKARNSDLSDFVILGDSRAYRGVDPRVISRHTGLKGVNLGFSSAGYGPLLYDLAEKRLSPSGARIILVGLTANAFTELAANNSHLKSYLSLPFGDLWAGIYIDRYFQPFAPLDLGRLRRWERKVELHENYIEDYQLETGFVASDWRQRNPFASLDGYRKEFEHRKASRLIELNFLRQIEQWQAQGIRIVAFEPPVHSSLADLEIKTSGYSSDWMRKELKARKIVLVAPSLSEFESYDGSHLTKQSAERFSGLIGRATVEATARP